MRTIAAIISVFLIAIIVQAQDEEVDYEQQIKKEIIKLVKLYRLSSNPATRAGYKKKIKLMQEKLRNLKKEEQEEADPKNLAAKIRQRIDYLKAQKLKYLGRKMSSGNIRRLAKIQGELNSLYQKLTDMGESAPIPAPPKDTTNEDVRELKEKVDKIERAKIMKDGLPY